MPQPNAARWPKPLLLAFALSATACSTLSPPPPLPVQPPAIPAPPSELMTPPEPGLWSDTVRSLFQRWQKLLMPAKDA